MESPIRILIVEDEFTTIDNLIDSLEEVGYEISGYAMTAEKALTILDKGETDLAILDIHIKGEKTGIWLGAQIREKYKIPFIYLTAFSDKATIKTAAQTAPATYLIKPFITADIYAAIEMALTNFPKKDTPLSSTQNSLANELVINETVFVKKGTAYKKLQIKEILFIQAFKNYLELTTSKERHIIRYTLQAFIQMLPRQDFIQTHRSFVININQVEEIKATAILIQSHSIPISATYKNKVMEQLKLF